eukprot:228077-Chlamydomonas_euryale.AAC.7
MSAASSAACQPHASRIVSRISATCQPHPQLHVSRMSALSVFGCVRTQVLWITASVCSATWLGCAATFAVLFVRLPALLPGAAPGQVRSLVRGKCRAAKSVGRLGVRRARCPLPECNA